MLDNKLLMSMISLVAGVVLTTLVSMLRNKTAVLNHSINIQHTALSGEDQIFGKIQVIWQGNDVANVYLATIDIENNTISDFENVKFIVYTDPDTFLLNQKTVILGTPNIVTFSASYMEEIAVSEGKTPTEAQSYKFFHRREYSVPVFNRGNKLQLSYLCTVPVNNKPPEVYIHCQSKGIKLKQQILSNVILGVPGSITGKTGLIIALLVVLGCGILLRNIWLVASLCMLVGLFIRGIAAFIYKAKCFARRIIAG